MNGGKTALSETTAKLLTTRKRVGRAYRLLGDQACTLGMSTAALERAELELTVALHETREMIGTLGTMRKQD